MKLVADTLGQATRGPESTEQGIADQIGKRQLNTSGKEELN